MLCVRLVTASRTTHHENMTLPIKLISTDFDGTLFAEFENPPIPPGIVSLIADSQARGAKWVINTGRDMSSLMEALARSRISIQPDFLVLVEREIYWHDGVRYAPAVEWNSACARDHEGLFAQVRPEVPALTAWINARFRATVYADAFSPFCLIAGNNGDADLIHAELNEFCGRFPHLTVVRNDVYARFCHAAYNKGTALAELTKQLGLTRDDVFAAGDHLNDLPMLSTQYARWLAAPHNAIPSVKEVVRQQEGFVSRFVCGDGVAEGLAYHLQKLQSAARKQ
jgi:hydroxymethylpyrimidine pyrophosphatase-like HAD family hydrolase